MAKNGVRKAANSTECAAAEDIALSHAFGAHSLQLPRLLETSEQGPQPLFSTLVNEFALVVGLRDVWNS